MFLNMKLKLANQRAQEGPHLNGERLTRMVVRCGARGGSLGLPTVFVAVPTPVDCRLHRKETAKKMLCKSDWCFVSVRESECIHGTKNSPKNFTVFRSSQLLLISVTLVHYGS